MICRDARLDLSGRNIKHLSSQATDLPHAFLLLLVQDGDIVSPDKLLLGSRNAILRVVGMGDGLRDGSRGGQRIDGSQGAGELVGGEGIVKTGGWIWFRNYLWREEVGEDITLFMDGLVFALTRELVLRTLARKLAQRMCLGQTKPTQLRLKQSCEQKKLSVPIFRQVGHCRLPALFSHSTPIHFRAATAAMLTVCQMAKG